MNSKISFPITFNSLLCKVYNNNLYTFKFIDDEYLKGFSQDYLMEVDK